MLHSCMHLDAAVALSKEAGLDFAALKHDPREVARIAREDLNLVRAGEVVFEVQLPGADGGQ